MPVAARASTASSTSTESSTAGSGTGNVTASGEIEAPFQESESSSVEESYKSKFSKVHYDAPGSYDPFGIENKKKRLEAEKYSQWIAFQKWVKNKKMSNANGRIKSQKSA